MLNKNQLNKEKEFNEKQLEAIELLARKELEGWSMEYIGQQVGVTRKTLHLWLKDYKFNRAVNDRALMCLADYSPVVLKNASDFLHSKDEKIKIKGVELVMKSVEAQEKAKEETKRQEESKIDVDLFLKQLGIPETTGEWIVYLEKEIEKKTAELNRLKQQEQDQL